MRTALLLFVDFLVGLAKLAGPGGTRGLLAEMLLLKHQLIVLKRSRKRAPNLTSWDRFFLGWVGFFMTPVRIAKNTVVLSTATLFKFHHALKRRKYSQLFSNWRVRKPGPKGPSRELIDAIVEMKNHNPRFGCPRIAQQINKAFGVDIDKDVVRRVLAKYYRPKSSGGGPSWLTVLGHAKDSLWSVDLFRCESILLTTHWVMVVMDQFSRRIIGFGVCAGPVGGPALCRMFNCASQGAGVPKKLSQDNDPLYRYHRWKSNLRVLEVEEIKSVPYVPWSHPFVERLIGTVRRELLDRTLFWNAGVLEAKLGEFKEYFNGYRTHSGIDSVPPAERAGRSSPPVIKLSDHRWKLHCRGLFQTPIAA